MNYTRAFIVGGLVSALPLWAVYAPIPAQEQGQAFTVSVRAGLSHDSNIFGAKNGEISSTVFTFAPRLAFNASLDAQTFLSASYALTVDNFSDRPGDKTLDSHALSARLAHAFSPATTIDVRDDYLIAKNPESLLSGLTLNSDQSFKRNEFDGKFETSLAAQTSSAVKFRSINYSYDSASLGASLDRTENLFGLSGRFDAAPETKAVAEYRHEVIQYRTAGANKDKNSNFLLGGVDYVVAKEVTATARLGYEWRKRDLERDLNSPYVELTVRYDYGDRAFLSAGYLCDIEESSNPAFYTDTKVNRFFINVQQPFSALIVGSGSITYEPSELQGRIGHANASEDTTRFGLALSYLPSKNWVLSANYDVDSVSSDDISRGLHRVRTGVSAVYSF